MASKESRRTENSAVSNFVKYMSFTDGRDKVNRTVQYAARFILWYLDRNGGAQSTVDRIDNLEKALTMSRKLFRMARTLDFLQKVLDALNKKDDTEKALEVLGYLFKAGWLSIDHAIWFGKIKFIQMDTKLWSERSAWLWLAANSTLVARDMYQLQQIDLESKELRRAGDPVPGNHLRERTAKIRLQLAVDLCDVLIPLASLGYVSKGLGAAGGLASSVVGGYTVWERKVKS